ncbi:MAG: hypothetical protein OIF40_01270 [Mangrovicoccus sp.]|nr:hypothetical protein [Mangrovicoccus sp.]
MKLLRLLALSITTGLIAAGPAQAVSFNDDPLGFAYSQANGFSQDIEIRIAPEIEQVWPELLSLESSADWALAYEQARTTPDQVSLFVVETISWCGATGSYGSCTAFGGNYITITYASDVLGGAPLLAKELGRNLGLSTDNSDGNLMNAYGYGEGLLSPAQVAVVEASPLIQSDAEGYYVQVQRYRIVPASQIAPVPLPGSGALLGAGVLLAAHLRSRKNRRAAAKAAM